MHWTDVNMVVLRDDGTWQAITTDASACGVSTKRVIIFVDTFDNRVMAQRLTCTDPSRQIHILRDDNALEELKLC